MNTLKEIFMNQSKSFSEIVNTLTFDQRKYLIKLIQEV